MPGRKVDEEAAHTSGAGTRGSARSRRRGAGRVSPEAAPTVDVRGLREGFGLTRADFRRLTGYSERAVANWEAGRPPDTVVGRRLRELERLRNALVRVMRADAIGYWLQRPNDAFGGLKPLEVVERGELDRLWRMVYELESGGPA